ncbi:Ribonuclease/ribotoxin, partial [Ceratobasidium sp. AG-I]
SNAYPHVFNNREGFTFNSGCKSPYYEFPLFRSSVYTGGDPSYNRVIIGSVSGSNAAFCDVVTHYGASGNNFLQCDNA